MVAAYPSPKSNSTAPNDADTVFVFAHGAGIGMEGPSMNKHEITAVDIMSVEDYAEIRRERRLAVTEMKKLRRVSVGPDATFYFENYATMWHQVHEMLFIEKGGEAQVADELAAYNPLIPKGGELVATLMFEIDDDARRAQFLAGLGGVEETITLGIADQTIAAVAEDDVERTTAGGKASSIHFLRFPFIPEQVATFRQAGTRIVLAVGHPAYGHMAVIPEDVREALAGDFD